MIVIPSNKGGVIGKENIHVLEQQPSSKALSQEVVSGLPTDMNQAGRNGVGYAGIPLVPVDISLCDGEHCQSDSLDTGKPVKESVTPSGR
ncbi:hypothetical protein RO060_004782 [Salmonella enterica]|nr:hypothetical protein [Salmonella enterica]EJS5026740.1 hypothetical protein [Salmonella enterica]ELH3243531.1 hypothetical protein [Salmonella enterica]